MEKLHVHFMGIGGSGCANIALLSSEMGFLCSGCDQSDESYYGKKLKEKGIPLKIGHDRAHISEDVDIVAVSPAIFDVNPDEPELLLAKERGILMTWQEFMGKYLQKDKRVIAISGTHGKTTTTFLIGDLLISAGLCPTVVGGSSYEKFGAGSYYGTSDLFVCEADEFNYNFHHYFPEIAVLNNVEMDHPECYPDYESVVESFAAFLRNDEKLKQVILSLDSPGCRDVMKKTYRELTDRGVKIFGTTTDSLTKVPEFSEIKVVNYVILSEANEHTVFRVFLDGTHEFELRMNGAHNVSNAVHAFIVSHLLQVPDGKINETFREFNGVGRRFDLVGTYKNVPVYDDYAHHPTEITAVLKMCKSYYPDRRLLVYFEPHQISRLTLMFREYADALAIADKVIIGKTHMGREIHTGLQPIGKDVWEKASEKITLEEDFERAVEMIREEIDHENAAMVLVIGAASSYKISQAVIDTKKG